MFFTFYTKALLKNKNIWGWGVIFMLFWLFLGAFVMSSSLPQGDRIAYLDYTASWFGLITLFTLSTLGITIAYSLIYSTHSLSYSFKFTKLRPSTYLGNAILSSTIVGLILSMIMVGFTYAFFGYKFGMDMGPKELIILILISALSGIFMFSFTILLVLLTINYFGLKHQNFVSFIPLLLGYAFGFTQLYVQLPSLLVYLSPYNNIQDLLYYAYSGQPFPLVFTNPNTITLNPLYSLFSLILWTVFLLLLDLYLFGKIRPRNVEEARQI